MVDYTKRRKTRIALITVAGLLALVLIVAAAGGLFGVEQEDPSSVDKPVFSRESGFYEKDFDLELGAAKGVSILYTLDGSDPLRNGKEYEGPLHMKDATPNENVYSMNTDVSTGFYVDLIAKYSGQKAEDVDPGYQAPQYPVDKCNVVRAVAVDSMGRSSKEVTGTYFVGIDPSSYEGCGILSLVTDPENLFDEEEGIYVTGEKFKEYAASEAIKDYHGIRWRYWNANYEQRGKEWERDVDLEFFDKNGKQLLQKTAGARIHGGVSRGTLPKSFRFYGEDAYGKSDHFDYDFFGTDYRPKSMILSCGGSEPAVQCCDFMMKSLLEGSDVAFATMDFQPYVLFIDGEYWGFYWLETRYDDSYCARYYGVDPDNVLLIKVGQVSSGQDEHRGLYTNMKDLISGRDMSDPDNYKEACKLIDMDSFIDYYAVQIYIARGGDWPSKNYALWRTVRTAKDKYSDGKWRWMLFDSDSQALKVSLVNDDTLTYVREKDALFGSLWANEAFREKFRKRIFEISDECFNDEKVDAFFEGFTDITAKRMSRSWKRFYGTNCDVQKDYYYGKIDSYHQFFKKRRAVVENWFE